MSRVKVMEQETVLKKRQTFVRRVSDLFKDGTYSGPPSLFRHTSMQKLRHCCQNLNLFPYLLYSFENSKSHPIAKKVNVHLEQYLKRIVENLFFIYTSIRHLVLREIRSETKPSIPAEKKIENLRKSRIFRSIKQKPKEISYLLLTAIYLVPFILVLQLIAIGNLLIVEKHTPGFIFLVTALFCLGYITLKVMFCDKTARKTFKNEKRKKK